MLREKITWKFVLLREAKFERLQRPVQQTFLIRPLILLTDLEKAMQVTARSKNPIPMTCSVFRVTESQTRTCGGNCYKINTEITAETMVVKKKKSI